MLSAELAVSLAKYLQLGDTRLPQPGYTYGAVAANERLCLPINPQKNDQGMAWSFDGVITEAERELQLRYLWLRHLWLRRRRAQTLWQYLGLDQYTWWPNRIYRLYAPSR